MAFDTFDTDAIATSGVTFSNANLTALAGSGSLANSLIAQSVEGKTAGKWYVEFTFNAASGNNDAVGLITSLGVYGLSGDFAIGFDNLATSWGYYNVNGHIVNSAGASGAVNNVAYAAGDVIAMAIDLDNELLWFRHNTGAWVGTSGTPNPATATGGFSLSPAVSFGRCYPACNMSGNLAKFTANFGASSFTGAVPSGFTAGWTNTTAGTYFGTFATSGRTGAALVAAPASGDKVATKWTAGLTGALSSISFAFKAYDYVQGIIYADASGSPGALLGVSSNSFLSGSAELEFLFSGISVVSGTQYWFGVNITGTAPANSIFAPPLTGGVAFNASTAGSPSNPFGAATLTANRLPMIANVAPAATIGQTLFKPSQEANALERDTVSIAQNLFKPTQHATVGEGQTVSILQSLHRPTQSANALERDAVAIEQGLYRLSQLAEARDLTIKTVIAQELSPPFQLAVEKAAQRYVWASANNILVGRVTGPILPKR